jgi:hypothetical protein
VSSKPIIVAVIGIAVVGTGAGIAVIHRMMHPSTRDQAREDAVRRIEVAQEAARREGVDPRLAQFRAASDDLPAQHRPPPPPPRAVDAEALGPVLGPRPAQPGPLLAGHGTGDVETYEERFDAHVELHADDRFGGPVVRFDGAGLRAAVEARWGPTDAGAYYDPAHRLRALVDDDTVRFGRYQTIGDLVVPGEPLRLGVAPIVLVGETTETARDVLGPDGRGLADAGEVEYYLPPLDAGSRPVSVGVLATKGVVSRLDVAVPVEGSAEADAVLAALSRKLGPPSVRADGASTWTRDGFQVAAAHRDEYVRIKVVPAPAP